MRPGQNKRMRGRNGGPNNRKGPNPLTRSYESNGPDVKIRGTAHHVAEKYLQLARDAQSSGDPVMAESYLQHAEHYFRLIAAAQLAQQQAQTGYARPPGEADYDDDDDDDFSAIPDRFASPPERVPQPSFTPPTPSPAPQQQPQQGQGQPYGDRPSYSNGGDRGFRQPYQDRNGAGQGGRFNQNRGPRDNQNGGRRDFRNDQPRDFAGEGQPRQEGQRQDGPRQDGPRQEGQRQEGQRRDASTQDQPRMDMPRMDQPRQDQPRHERPEPRAAEPEAAAALPAFITAPVRVSAPEPAVEEASAPEWSEPRASAVAEEGEAGEFHLRPRRRRRRPEGEAATEAAPRAPTDDAPVGE